MELTFDAISSIEPASRDVAVDFTPMLLPLEIITDKTVTSSDDDYLDVSLNEINDTAIIKDDGDTILPGRGITITMKTLIPVEVDAYIYINIEGDMNTISSYEILVPITEFRNE
jgi:hypothetical protein